MKQLISVYVSELLEYRHNYTVLNRITSYSIEKISRCQSAYSNSLHKNKLIRPGSHRHVHLKIGSIIQVSLDKYCIAVAACHAMHIELLIGLSTHDHI